MIRSLSCLTSVRSILCFAMIGLYSLYILFWSSTTFVVSHHFPIISHYIRWPKCNKSLCTTSWNSRKDSTLYKGVGKTVDRRRYLNSIIFNSFFSYAGAIQRHKVTTHHFYTAHQSCGITLAVVFQTTFSHPNFWTHGKHIHIYEHVFDMFDIWSG